MSKDRNNPPAFPRPVSQFKSGEECAPLAGMDLRTYLAAQALPAVIDTCRRDAVAANNLELASPANIAKEAYAVADAVLSQRAGFRPSPTSAIVSKAVVLNASMGDKP